MKRTVLILLSTFTLHTTMAATVTAYCHCADCNGTAGKPTASGKLPQRFVTVAGPRNVPFGTRVYIEGVGVRTVQDRTHKKFDGRWDIFTTSHQRAKNFGRRELRVTILK